jgi:hypothetical protein
MKIIARTVEDPSEGQTTAPILPRLREESPVKLSSSHLVPVIDEPLRSDVIDAVIEAIRRSPLARRVSSKKVRAVLERSLERFCDGARFDFGPIARRALELPGVSADDCRQAATLLRRALAAHLILVESGEIDRAEVPSRRRLGALLLENRTITAAQLEEALARQASLGGRLASHLLQLRAATEGALAHVLGLQLNVPAADPSSLRRLSHQTLALLPAELCRRHRVLPIGAGRGAIRVVMSDPTDAAAREAIAAHSGLKVLPSIVLEHRLDALLADAYGRPRAAPRAISMVGLDAGAGEDFQVIHTSTPRRRRGLPQLGAPAPAAGAAITVEDRDDFLQAERGDLVQDRAKAEDLARDLGRALDRAAVLRVGAQMLATAWGKAAAFLVADGAAVGCAEVGTTRTEEELRRIMLSIEHCPLLSAAAARGSPLSGRVVEGSLEHGLLVSLGAQSDAPLICVPIFDRGALVGIVLGVEPAATPAGDLAQRIQAQAAIALQIVALRAQLAQI